MLNFITLLGEEAYAASQMQAIQSQCHDIDATVNILSAHQIYYLYLKSPLSQDEMVVLSQLLQVKADWDINLQAQACNGEYWYVAPRLGSISPWSDSATEIVHSCGFIDKVNVIERGVVWLLDKKHVNLEVLSPLYDRMTQRVESSLSVESIFQQSEGASYDVVPLPNDMSAFQSMSKKLGLALGQGEMAYLKVMYGKLKRDPTDVELMMFSQIHSEHCRHKFFNAPWKFIPSDFSVKDKSLFSMIKNTVQSIQMKGIEVAYEDNAAVLSSLESERLEINAKNNCYTSTRGKFPILIKVETHNHPTAIEPYEGAATGVGGEIRDEAAVGRGSKTHAGLSGYTTSHLNLPNFSMPWEINYGKPDWFASPLEIMLKAPIGAARFGNEFGRPNLLGYFRTFEYKNIDGSVRGFHKPLMLAGGIGSIRGEHVLSKPISVGSLVIVLGGPGFRIGVGGGSVSSVGAGELNAELDFASVQRSHAEMERRCQEVIDRCCALGENNPILLIHDVGAGGLSNAVPELLKDGGKNGASIQLRSINAADSSLTPLELWCNESQERYVLAIEPEHLKWFELTCIKERCPFCVIGKVEPSDNLHIEDEQFDNSPVDLSLDDLFGRIPLSPIQYNKQERLDKEPAVCLKGIDFEQMVRSVLQFPAVASKKFLITIADRSVSGLVMRDQMVGKWQVPVSDVAVTALGYRAKVGKAMAIGERPQVALLNPAASARLAITEALLNIFAADIQSITDIKLSANWMAASSIPSEQVAIYEAVHEAAMHFCPQLGVGIPVGKDSLSMQSEWVDNGESKSVVSPMTLNVSAFAHVSDGSKTLTPCLVKNEETKLLYVYLGLGGDNPFPLGGSVLGQCFSQLGNDYPDVCPKVLKGFLEELQTLKANGSIEAYHDCSDGGLGVALFEMSFAGRIGLDVDLTEIAEYFSDCSGNINAEHIVFSEVPGCVIQVPTKDCEQIQASINTSGALAFSVATVNTKEVIRISLQGRDVIVSSRLALERVWSELSFRMQSIRDSKECAEEELLLLEEENVGLSSHVTFDVTFPSVIKSNANKPKVAILREQGVNGHYEMAYAFQEAGFECFDIHMSDLKAREDLAAFSVLAICGGFSYGDVLGAGRGWASTILHHDHVREKFETFFQREDTLTLGVCNGCQMLSQLKSIIPGTSHWPSFMHNRSLQFESRVALIKIEPSASPFLQDMVGSVLPVPIAHAEGKAHFDLQAYQKLMQSDQNMMPLRYVDNAYAYTDKYPYNPNGSTLGVAGVSNDSGRVLAMMPHPERVIDACSNSWRDPSWGSKGPWFQLFRNAFTFCQ